MERKNLIFDVDGTLWDATEQITEAYNEVILSENSTYPKITKEMMESVMGWLIEDIADKFFPYLPSTERLNFIEKCCNNENEHLKKHGGVLYPHVEYVLEKLQKKFDLYIVSNCQSGYVDALFTAHPIGKYFIDSECSGNTGLKKGDNLQLIMKKHNMQNAIYIGDTQKDQQACEEAKIPFVYAAYGFGSVEKYDMKVDSFSELLRLFDCE